MTLIVNFGVTGLTDVVYQFFSNTEHPIGPVVTTGVTSPEPGKYSAEVTIPSGAVSVRWTSPSLDSTIADYDIFPAPSAGTTITVVDLKVNKPLPTIPRRTNLGMIDVQDVRDFIFDRTIGDNVMDLDLVFSDSEITNAMRFAAMKYNETTPFVDTVNPAHLPYGMLFLNGIAASMYMSKLQLESRQDIAYTAGNLTVDIYQRRIKHLQEFAAAFKTEFDQMTKERKVSINMHQFFRAF